MDAILLDSFLDPAKQQWVVLVIGLMAVSYLLFRPRFRKRDPLEKPPVFGSLAQQRAVEQQMQNLLVELSEMARQISAQLDTRAGKLELLIKDADERIAALREASVAPASQTSSQASRSDVPGRLAGVEPDSAADPRHAKVYALADEGQSARQIAQAMGRPSGEIELIWCLGLQANDRTPSNRHSRHNPQSLPAGMALALLRTIRATI